MEEPAVRNIALLPVLAVTTGAVIVLSTVVGQGVSASQECPPGTHAMQTGGMDSGGGDSMGGMDHSAHMASGSGTECMPGLAGSMDTGEMGSGGAPDQDTPPAKSAEMPGMDHGTMPAKKAEKKDTSSKSVKQSKTTQHSKTTKHSRHGTN